MTLLKAPVAVGFDPQVSAHLSDLMGETKQPLPCVEPGRCLALSHQDMVAF